VYAVQLASQARLHVVATAGFADLQYVKGLGAERVLDYRAERFEESLGVVDVGTVLPFEEARIAHEMLGGAPHKRGKIVLRVAS
jgi:NADPH:quinone reductase-like Zn-dependent oxidoreductase